MAGAQFPQLLMLASIPLLSQLVRLPHVVVDRPKLVDGYREQIEASLAHVYLSAAPVSVRGLKSPLKSSVVMLQLHFTSWALSACVCQHYRDVTVALVPIRWSDGYITQ
jgi:hypothetical protein